MIAHRTAEDRKTVRNKELLKSKMSRVIWEWSLQTRLYTSVAHSKINMLEYEPWHLNISRKIGISIQQRIN